LGLSVAGRRCDRLLLVLYRHLASESAYREFASTLAALSPSYVIDVGGGTGLLGRALRGLGWQGVYVLVDPDECLVGDAPEHPRSLRLEARGEALPLPPLPGSVAVFHDALHHMEEPEEALREAARVAECVAVKDFDVSGLSVKILKILEKLFGYPARFSTLTHVKEALELLGFRVTTLTREPKGGFTLVACKGGRRRHGSH